MEDCAASGRAINRFSCCMICMRWEENNEISLRKLRDKWEGRRRNSQKIEGFGRKGEIQNRTTAEENIPNSAQRSPFVSDGSEVEAGSAQEVVDESGQHLTLMLDEYLINYLLMIAPLGFWVTFRIKCKYIIIIIINWSYLLFFYLVLIWFEI